MALSLYLHIPYCRSKCPYCDFYSEAVTTPVDIATYVDALLVELTVWRAYMVDDPRPLSSIFIGGGTPSLLPVSAVERLLAAVSELWPWQADCEITLEANPESVCHDTLSGYRQAGINRLSLGIQSFNTERLQQLGRCHDVTTARQAVALARQVGFNQLNLDLIYATPAHTIDAWQRELEEAMAWQPEHLSCYELSADQGRWALPDEEQQLIFWQLTRQTLSQHGWFPYEVSNFARPGHQCRHNNHYWDFGDYIGVGAAAHGKWSDGQGGVYRSVNERDTGRYLGRLLGHSGDSVVTLTPISRQEAARECLIMGLRTATGLCRHRYAATSGGDLVSQRAAVVEQLVAAGLMTVTADRITLTESGLAVANAVLLALM
ncbi:MAG: radical SAM family heme chaperone HemW [Magnetococcales bacterium]|nr:radical SAM family heme chaperone HemW [Magnetococcales bacterium]